MSLDPRTLVADLTRLGTLHRKTIVALVGVAPFNRDSGALRGKRTLWDGHATVRAAFRQFRPALLS